MEKTLSAKRENQNLMLFLCNVCVQGFSFLHRYLGIRGPCQESYYNLGRGLHQLGLVHLAIHYYQKALELPPVVLEVLYSQIPEP